MSSTVPVIQPVKETPVIIRPTPSQEDRDDLKRGKTMMVIFILILFFLGAVYVWAHYQRPNGPFAPTAAALGVVADARATLEAANGDILDPASVATLSQLSSRLGLLAAQLGMGSDYTSVLDKITTELGGNEVHRSVLLPLFTQMENLIRVGAGSYFWSGSLDRWIELLFWTVVGTLVFLLSEIKKYSSQPYHKNRDFILYTPWYIINFFRGPFIAMVILLALLSLSVNAIGISIDLKAAPVEVLIVAAAILGFYSRIANEELDIIAAALFGAAWKKAHPEEQSDQAALNKSKGEQLPGSMLTKGNGAKPAEEDFTGSPAVPAAATSPEGAMPAPDLAKSLETSASGTGAQTPGPNDLPATKTPASPPPDDGGAD